MKKLISNKYYVTTIIAIFLSLSIGILIGGTLGQQWININQQKLITYYEQKSRELQKLNESLINEHSVLTSNYQNTRNELYSLYTKSISNTLANKQFLFISDVSLNNNSIRDSIELAGGNIIEIDSSKELNDDTLYKNIDISNYDAVILFIKNNESNDNYQWLETYQIPIMYIKEDLLIKFTKEDSYNENYRFINYLKYILQEQTDE